jgi:hypothetical protein
MKGSRCVLSVGGASSGRTLCVLAPRVPLEIARKVARVLATHYGHRVTASRSNPTLVHHGIAQGANFHLFTQAGAPLADLYVGRVLATAVAQCFADHMDTPAHLVENDDAGKHGIADPTRRKSPYRGISESMIPPAKRRANPRGGPRVVFNRLLGGWYVVVGPHQTPLNGRFNSKAEAQAWLSRQRRTNPSRSRAAKRVRATMRRKGISSRKVYRTRAALERAEDTARHEASGSRAKRDAANAAVRSLRAKLGRYMTQSIERRRAGEARTRRLARRMTIQTGFEPRTPRKYPRNPKRAIGATYDALGNGIGVRSVLVGTGLANAGRSYTVLAMKGLRVLLEPHLGGKPFWTFARHYRVDTASNPRRSRRANPSARLAPGTRVTATVYGVKRHGTVIEQRSAGVVWVRWDGSPRQTWMHRDSLTASNPSRSRRAKLVRASMRRAFNRKERRAIAQGAGGRAPGKSRGVVSRHGARRKARTGSTLKATHRPRRNPSSVQLERAAGTFRKWHDFAPRNIRRTNGRKTIPSVLVKLGEIVQFVYRSDKWSGKPVTYEHRTKLPRPQLCTGADGRGLYVIGGRTRVTARGLVD